MNYQYTLWFRVYLNGEEIDDEMIGKVISWYSEKIKNIGEKYVPQSEWDNGPIDANPILKVRKESFTEKWVFGLQYNRREDQRYNWDRNRILTTYCNPDSEEKYPIEIGEKKYLVKGKSADIK